MTDTRTVTREQLAAALKAIRDDAYTPFLAPFGIERNAALLFAALPAAAPAEGLREEDKHRILAATESHADALEYAHAEGYRQGWDAALARHESAGSE